MKKGSILSICILSIFLFSSSMYSAFVEQRWSARASAMGGAYTAIADDGSAPMYNPAGIAQLNKMEFNSMYTFLFPALEVNTMGLAYLSFSFPSTLNFLQNIGAFSVSWVHYYASELYSESAFQISYGRKTHEFWTRIGKDLQHNELYIGANIKFLQTSFLMKDTDADPLFERGKRNSTIAFDMGILSKIYSKKNKKYYKVGFSIFNINTPDIGLISEDRVPLCVKLGGTIPVKTLPFMKQIYMSSPQVAVDITYRKRTNFHFGWENKFFKILAFRFGGNLDEVSTGIGVDTDINRGKYNIKFNYSFIFPFRITSTGGIHFISFIMRFKRL